MSGAPAVPGALGVEYADAKSEIPAVPAAPVGPVAPVAPVGPVGPVAPVAPVGPVGPVAPVAPVGAVTYGICLFVCPRKSAGAFEMNL